MNPLLTSLLTWLAGAGVRFIEVLVIAALIIGGPFLIYRHGLNQGYKNGYSQALTDHPQQIYTAPATVNNNPPRTSAIYGLKLGRAWGIGVCHE